MKYRIYRKRFCFEYKDVEANSAREAERHYIDERKDFVMFDSGYVEFVGVEEAPNEEPSQKEWKKFNKG